MANTARKHFLDPVMCAINVMEISLPPEKLTPAMAMARTMQDAFDSQDTVTFTHAGEAMELSPFWPRDWHSDIAWWSPTSPQGFAVFEALFDDLGIASHVAHYIDCDEAPRLFAGSIITRRRCEKSRFHCDWVDGDNQGFTLMAPLTANAREVGLSYYDFHNSVRRYDYELGKGLLFGDHFLHATTPGQSSEPIAFLCLNFGTDRMDNWDKLQHTTGQQGRLHRRPDGVFVLDGKELHCQLTA